MKNRTIIIGIVAVLAVALVLVATVRVISPTERGVKVTFGKAGDSVLQPGLVVKAPFIQKVKKYDMSPKQLNVDVTMGADAAVTQDMQSVAVSGVVYWTYDESRILDIINGYSDSTIKTLVKDNVMGAVKEVIGKYSIYDIVEKQEEVTRNIKDSIQIRLANYPISVSSFTINNYDWSQEFDNQINNTMKMAQQVKVAQQELEVTKQEAQKQVAEANAAKEKAVIEAEMKVAVAEQNALAAEATARGTALAAEATAKGTANAAKVKAEGESEALRIKAQAEADAAKLKADADAYAKEKEGAALAAYYQSLSKYQAIIEAIRNLDIEETRADNWNGVEVSTYLPMTANGTLVAL